MFTEFTQWNLRRKVIPFGEKSHCHFSLHFCHPSFNRAPMRIKLICYISLMMNGKCCSILRSETSGNGEDFGEVETPYFTKGFSQSRLIAAFENVGPELPNLLIFLHFWKHFQNITQMQWNASVKLHLGHRPGMICLVVRKYRVQISQKSCSYVWISNIWRTPLLWVCLDVYFVLEFF